MAEAVTLTEFLRARIAEDEAVAQTAGHEGSRWATPDGYGSGAVEAVDCPPREVGIVVYDEGRPSEQQAAHIARHDPARVLAECEAKRQIVELHESWPVLVEKPPEFEWDLEAEPGRAAMRMSQEIAWLTEQQYRARFGSEPPTAPILRALAAIWSDHPDYQEEWK